MKRSTKFRTWLYNGSSKGIITKIISWLYKIDLIADMYNGDYLNESGEWVEDISTPFFARRIDVIVKYNV